MCDYLSIVIQNNMLSRQLRHLNRAAPAARRVFVPRASSQPRFFQGTASSNNEETTVAERQEEEGFDLWKTLSNPLYGLPIGGIAAASAVANGFYVINEETQLLGLWVLFVGTVYHNFGGAIGEFFDEGPYFRESSSAIAANDEWPGMSN